MLLLNVFLLANDNYKIIKDNNKTIIILPTIYVTPKGNYIKKNYKKIIKNNIKK
jgi:hypothetical protein